MGGSVRRRLYLAAVVLVVSAWIYAVGGAAVNGVAAAITLVELAVIVGVMAFGVALGAAAYFWPDR